MVIENILDRTRFKNYPQLITNLKKQRDSFIEAIRSRIEGAKEPFVNVMLTLSIAKLAAAVVTLIVMMVLFFTNLHVFAPITSQFSKWVSSPLIVFAISIMILKFVGISIGLTLTILSVKKTTIKSVRLRLKEAIKLRLSFFLRKKLQPQITHIN